MVKRLVKCDVILGLQWGDEGKGKIIDCLSQKNQYDGTIRFQGGANAGHTLEFDNSKVVLHVIPSNIFQEGAQSIIANGVVLDPIIFMQEILDLVTKFATLSIDELLKKIVISKNAHVILPSHKLLDRYQEEKKGKNKCGTTLKGIGPTYGDKIARIGFRIEEINEPSFEERAKKLYYDHLSTISSKFPEIVFDLDIKKLFNQWLDAIQFLKKITVIDTVMHFDSSINNSKIYLGEGAQGTFLDIDHGTYPMVTASNTTIGGFFSGTGLNHKHIRKVYGLFKAYTTRVGEGPFPTELYNSLGETLRKNGNEYGATTGRPRRCGWLDLVMLKYACLLNGVDELIISKADVLNGMNGIKVCIAYENGQTFPNQKAKPIYQKVRGWKSLVNKNGKLSKGFAAYIKLVEDYLGIPVTIISTGPDRKDIIWR